MSDFASQKKKTILLTVVRGMTARNLLQNEFYTRLREKFKLVILTPAATDKRFVEEFEHQNVEFVYFDEVRQTRFDRILSGLHKYLVYSDYIGLKLRYGIRGLTRPEDLNIVRYYLLTAFFKPLSKIHFLRNIVKWVDYHTAQRSTVVQLRKLIREKEATLVLSTSIMSNTEAALIKAARKENIHTIGMPKSWDNPSRSAWRAKADMLVVWSQFMAEQSMAFQNYGSKEIHIIGIPQFDHYCDPDIFVSRDQFCKESGLDPKKRIILYTSEGKAIPEDRDIASLLYRFIENQELIYDSQLFVRPHFFYKDDEKKFVHLLNKPNVVVDLANYPSEGFRDHADYSRESIKRFVNTLYHADVVINVASTITLDAAAFDKPIINVAFDIGDEEPPLGYSLSFCYKSDYYKEIVNIGASKIARSESELCEYINRYLKDPSHEAQERAVLRERLCYKVDGKSGERFADFLTREINK